MRFAWSQGEVDASFGETCVIEAGSRPARRPGCAAGHRIVTTGFDPWQPVTGASYVLEAGSASGLTDLAVLNASGVIVNTVAPPGRHFVRARARTACGLGPASNEVIIEVR